MVSSIDRSVLYRTPGIYVNHVHRYALRVMTSAVVLYDRVSTTGVFTRSASVQTRKCLRTLHRAQGKGRGEEAISIDCLGLEAALSCTRKITLLIAYNTGGTSPPSSLGQQLLNSVKYSTIHFKDGSTPGYVRTYLGD